jgi:hypothetical protein
VLFSLSFFYSKIVFCVLKSSQSLLNLEYVFYYSINSVWLAIHSFYIWVICSSISYISFSMLFFLASSGPEFSSSPFFDSSSNCLLSLSTLCYFLAILTCLYLMSVSNLSTSFSLSFNSFIKSSSFFYSSSFYDCVFRLSILTLEISFAISSISTSFLDIFSYEDLVYLIRLAELFSIVFY